MTHIVFGGTLDLTLSVYQNCPGTPTSQVGTNMYCVMLDRIFYYCRIWGLVSVWVFSCQCLVYIGLCLSIAVQLPAMKKQPLLAFGVR